MIRYCNYYFEAYQFNSVNWLKLTPILPSRDRQSTTENTHFTLQRACPEKVKNPVFVFASFQAWTAQTEPERWRFRPKTPPCDGDRRRAASPDSS